MGNITSRVFKVVSTERKKLTATGEGYLGEQDLIWWGISWVVYVYGSPDPEEGRKTSESFLMCLLCLLVCLDWETNSLKSQVFKFFLCAWFERVSADPEEGRNTSESFPMCLLCLLECLEWQRNSLKSQVFPVLSPKQRHPSLVWLPGWTHTRERLNTMLYIYHLCMSNSTTFSFLFSFTGRRSSKFS